MRREIKKKGVGGVVGGGVMIPLAWQKRDWPHGRQGDTDRPMKKVFTQRSMCECIR